jgi:hypothetical protein
MQVRTCAMISNLSDARPVHDARTAREKSAAETAS